MLKHISSNTGQQQRMERGGLMLLLTGGPCEASIDAVQTGLEPLGVDEAWEQWLQLGPALAEEMPEDIAAGISGRCYWRHSDTVMSVAMVLDVDDCQSQSMAESAQEAYCQLISCANHRGFPVPVRLWNYLPYINEGAEDQELYKQFCLGRHQAFEAQSLNTADYPAASALGHSGDQGIIYGLFGRQPVQHIENPVQDSAYDYPRQYGPKSPSFARATLFDSCLLISGTASVIGSESVGEDDLLLQLQVTVENIQRLLTQSSGELHSVKVYLRHKEDYTSAYDYLSRQWPGVDALYIRADICRAELLVEIEAVAYVESEPLSSGRV